jgi:hypothetical protein
MEVVINRRIHHAVVLQEKDIRDLWEIFKSKYEKVAIRTYCRDGTELRDESPDGILNFPNHSDRRIKRIAFWGQRGESWRLESRLDFGDIVLSVRRVAATFSITAETDSEATQFANCISERVAETKPPFSWIATLNTGTCTVILVGLAMLIGWLARSLNVGILLTWLVLVAAFWAVQPIKDLVFPLLFFRIGRQEESYQEIRSKQMISTWGMFAGVLASLIAGWIYGHVLTGTEKPESPKAAQEKIAVPPDSSPSVLVR